MVNCPWKRVTPAWENAFPAITHVSLIRNFESKLSVASIIKS